MSNPYGNSHLKKIKLPIDSESIVSKEEDAKNSQKLDREIMDEIKDIEELEEEVSSMNIEKQPKSEMHNEIIDLQQELKEARNKLMYTFAEMENIRSHAKQDVEKTRKYILEKFINELIPAIDSLERSLESINRDGIEHPIFSGVKLTLNILLKAIEKFGVKQIDPWYEPFDPKFHEAMSTKKNTEVEINTVLTVLQKGYLLYDRLVRPALVVVSTSEQD